jgi:hypothetical protein
MSPGRFDFASTLPRDSGRVCRARALKPGVSSSSLIWPPVKLPGTEAAPIDRAVGQHTLAGDEPAHDLAGERQAARALVGGLRADDRIGDARGVVVLPVLADAAQFMREMLSNRASGSRHRKNCSNLPL